MKKMGNCTVKFEMVGNRDIFIAVARNFARNDIFINCMRTTANPSNISLRSCRYASSLIA